MENPGINNSEDRSSSENEDSPYFQRPQPAIHTAKRKERPEEVDETQSTQQCNSSDKKCFYCTRYRRKCDGTYPFTERCDCCKKARRSCYPEEERIWKIKPTDGKCSQCRESHSNCDGEYPFTQACSTCQASGRTCTAEAPENGLPKDQKCQRCFKNVVKCLGEPPFKNRCDSCKKKGYKCYAQGIEVPKPIPKPEKCLYCRHHQLACDDKKPCTKCVTRNVACNYKDGDAKWTYQTDPKKWKEPTSPTCIECVRWNQSHPSKTLTCDGKSPCNCCLEETGKAISNITPNCTYRYENGVTKSIKLPGERAQAVRSKRTGWRENARRKAASQKNATAEDADLLDGNILPNNTGDKNDSQDDKSNDPSQYACASFSYPYPDKSSDHDGNDLNAGGESDRGYTTEEDEELLNEDLLPRETRMKVSAVLSSI